MTSQRKLKKQAEALGLTRTEFELVGMLEEVLESMRWMQILAYTNQYLLHEKLEVTKAERDRILEAATRAVDLGDGFQALVTDTVGFIRKLPHDLVASFRATLAEVAAHPWLHAEGAARVAALEAGVAEAAAPSGAEDGGRAALRPDALRVLAALGEARG